MIRKALLCVVDVVVGMLSIYVLWVAYDALTYPLMDLCNAFGKLWGK
jgi:hypothetical protein